MQLIKFENVNLQTLVAAVAGIYVITLIFKLIDDISKPKPQAYSIFEKGPSRYNSLALARSNQGRTIQRANNA